MNEIEKYYTDLNEDSYVIDGINCEKTYSKQNIKILWILKEPYADDHTQSWDHRKFHRELLLKHKYWKMTHGAILTVTDLILNNMNKDLDKYEENEIYNIMKSIAIINIKKSAGTSTSTFSTIKKEYDRKKDILHQQIKDIGPNIIINGTKVWNVFSDLTEDCILKSVSKILNGKNYIWEYGISKYKLVINAYHPQQRSKLKQLNIETIKEIVNLEFPRFYRHINSLLNSFQTH